MAAASRRSRAGDERATRTSKYRGLQALQATVPDSTRLLGARLEHDFAPTREQPPGPLPEAAREAAQEVEQAARDEDAADAPAVCGDGEHLGCHSTLYVPNA